MEGSISRVRQKSMPQRTGHWGRLPERWCCSRASGREKTEWAADKRRFTDNTCFAYVARDRLLTRTTSVLGHQHNGRLPEGGLLSGSIHHGHLAVVFSGLKLIQGQAEPQRNRL